MAPSLKEFGKVSRREFIRLSALAATGACLASCCPLGPEHTTKNIPGSISEVSLSPEEILTRAQERFRATQQVVSILSRLAADQYGKPYLLNQMNTLDVKDIFDSLNQDPDSRLDLDELNVDGLTMQTVFSTALSRLMPRLADHVNRVSRCDEGETSQFWHDYGQLIENPQSEENLAVSLKRKRDTLVAAGDQETIALIQAAFYDYTALVSLTEASGLYFRAADQNQLADAMHQFLTTTLQPHMNEFSRIYAAFFDPNDSTVQRDFQDILGQKFNSEPPTEIEAPVLASPPLAIKEEELSLSSRDSATFHLDASESLLVSPELDLEVYVSPYQQAEVSCEPEPGEQKLFEADSHKPVLIKARPDLTVNDWVFVGLFNQGENASRVLVRTFKPVSIPILANCSRRLVYWDKQIAQSPQEISDLQTSLVEKRQSVDLLMNAFDSTRARLALLYQIDTEGKFFNQQPNETIWQFFIRSGIAFVEGVPDEFVGDCDSNFPEWLEDQRQNYLNVYYKDLGREAQLAAAKKDYEQRSGLDRNSVQTEVFESVILNELVLQHRIRCGGFQQTLIDKVWTEGFGLALKGQLQEMLGQGKLPIEKSIEAMIFTGLKHLREQTQILTDKGDELTNPHLMAGVRKQLRTLVDTKVLQLPSGLTLEAVLDQVDQLFKSGVQLTDEFLTAQAKSLTETFFQGLRYVPDIKSVVISGKTEMANVPKQYFWEAKAHTVEADIVDIEITQSYSGQAVLRATYRKTPLKELQGSLVNSQTDEVINFTQVAQQGGLHDQWQFIPDGARAGEAISLTRTTQVDIHFWDSIGQVRSKTVKLAKKHRLKGLVLYDVEDGISASSPELAVVSSTQEGDTLRTYVNWQKQTGQKETWHESRRLHLRPGWYDALLRDPRVGLKSLFSGQGLFLANGLVVEADCPTFLQLFAEAYLTSNRMQGRLADHLLTVYPMTRRNNLQGDRPGQTDQGVPIFLGLKEDGLVSLFQDPQLVADFGLELLGQLRDGQVALLDQPNNMFLVGPSRVEVLMHDGTTEYLSAFVIGHTNQDVEGLYSNLALLIDKDGRVQSSSRDGVRLDALVPVLDNGLNYRVLRTVPLLKQILQTQTFHDHLWIWSYNSLMFTIGSIGKAALASGTKFGTYLGGSIAVLSEMTGLGFSIQLMAFMAYYMAMAQVAVAGKDQIHIGQWGDYDR